jgi:hypothetical protein
MSRLDSWEMGWVVVQSAGQTGVQTESVWITWPQSLVHRHCCFRDDHVLLTRLIVKPNVHAKRWSRVWPLDLCSPQVHVWPLPYDVTWMSHGESRSSGSSVSGWDGGGSYDESRGTTREGGDLHEPSSVTVYLGVRYWDYCNYYYYNYYCCFYCCWFQRCYWIYRSLRRYVPDRPVGADVRVSGPVTTNAVVTTITRHTTLFTTNG